MSSRPATRQSIYDYPLYYDILFGWDRDAEAAFYDAAFRHYGIAPGARVIEVACGTGQVGRRLAKIGWRVTGLDISPAMLDFLNGEARDANLAIETLCADMSDFRVTEKYDAAFCPLGSIGILHDDHRIVSHLKAVAAALKPKGVYIVDMPFLASPQAHPESPSETWTMTRGPIEVSACGETIVVRDPSRPRGLTLSWAPCQREYTVAQFSALLSLSGGVAVEASHPHSRPDPDSLSFFDVHRREPSPGLGRGMLVLRRL